MIIPKTQFPTLLNPLDRFDHFDPFENLEHSDWRVFS